MTKNIVLAIYLLVISLSSWSSELYTGQAVMHNDSDEIMATVKFETPETGDMYVATIVNSKLLFLNQENSWTETIAPFKVNETFQGEYPLFAASAEILPPGNYPLYQLITKPNAKLFKEDGSLNVDDWIGGEDGLNFLSFSVGVADKVRVLAFNDLGMHCMDKTLSIFAILPPFNVVNAQVVKQDSNGKPQLLDANQIEVQYSAVTDRKGSINSSSKNKTDFWKYAKDLFGNDLQPGIGLTGFFMPADNPKNPGPQPFHYNAKNDWFSADGIPITPTDDQGQINAYPTLRVSAHDKKTGELLGATDIVVPVSVEVNCKICHATGESAAINSEIKWITDDDPDMQAQTDSLVKLEIQAKKNILLLHDKLHGTNLQDSTPVLCAKCHYTAALDLAAEGPKGVQEFFPTSSQVMHRTHGELIDTEENQLIPIGVKVEQNCYQCHPGKTTQCQRGAMKNVGLECTACHGGLLAVGGKFPLLEGGSIDGTNDGEIRRPWFDMPRCQSCHTGDAVDHLTGEGLELGTDGIRLKQAYKTGDKSASAILAKNKRFAENDNTLYRNSKGHSGVACEGCHGSTHAIWPIENPDANDNLTAIQLQGHSGTLIECDTCHTAGSLELTTKGPHGLHNINDPRWTNQHESFYKDDANVCKACHGKQLEGTPLAKMAATRSFDVKGKNVTLEKDQQVSCDLCHDKP
ncbi:hypothetical protein [Candidatus Parabeggiatoa sp. HSG14]|uniref:hypothetical protein n=1 Tax=Candidatus Parabeggiatoa sp. HSG14 TaxID=3055593 RepID=UPI0025A7BFFD|nr:hypothetical protein [Thiotrichales bacterium HSG14]